MALNGLAIVLTLSLPQFLPAAGRPMVVLIALFRMAAAVLTRRGMGAGWWCWYLMSLFDLAFVSLLGGLICLIVLSREETRRYCTG